VCRFSFRGGFHLPGSFGANQMGSYDLDRVCHRCGELIHSAREVCRERSLHLGKVYIDLVALQDDSLCEPGSSIGESYNRHSNDSAAPSKLNSIVAALAE